MLPRQTILLLLLSLVAFSSAAPLPLPLPEITISHISKSTGIVTSHEVDSDLLHPDLVDALSGNDINIHVITEKSKRHVSRPQEITRRAVLAEAKRSGIFNSTINATIISKKDTLPASDEVESAPHHNVLIDASSDGGEGGISDSVININFNSRRTPSPAPEPETTVEDHSVLLDLSSSSLGQTGSGIEESTVHINILTVRSPVLDSSSHKSVGHNSILIDSSSSQAGDTTAAGDHSAVVDTSNSTGIKSSTVNLTIVSPKEKVSQTTKRSSVTSEAGGNNLQRRLGSHPIYARDV